MTSGQIAYDAHEAACEQCRTAGRVMELCPVGLALSHAADEAKEKGPAGQLRCWDSFTNTWRVKERR